MATARVHSPLVREILSQEEFHTHLMVHPKLVAPNSDQYRFRPQVAALHGLFNMHNIHRVKEDRMDVQ